MNTGYGYFRSRKTRRFWGVLYFVSAFFGGISPALSQTIDKVISGSVAHPAIASTSDDQQITYRLTIRNATGSDITIDRIEDWPVAGLEYNGWFGIIPAPLVGNIGGGPYSSITVEAYTSNGNTGSPGLVSMANNNQEIIQRDVTRSAPVGADEGDGLIVFTGAGGGSILLPAGQELFIQYALEAGQDVDSIGVTDKPPYPTGTGFPRGTYDNRASVIVSGSEVANDSTFFYIIDGSVYASVSDFSAAQAAGQVVVSWSTASEIGTLGFTLERQFADGSFQPINQEMLPGLFPAQQGGVYRFADPTASPDETLTYRLVEHELSGNTLIHGPYTVTATEAGVAPVGGYDATPHAPSPSELSRLAAVPRTSRVTPGSGSVLQVGVTEDGVYRLDFSDLSAASGWSLSDIGGAVAASEVSISNQGNAVAWWTLEDVDALFFYGQAPPGNLTPDNVYWVALGEAGVTASVVGGDTPASALDTGEMRAVQHYEIDVWEGVGLTSDPSGDFWHWLALNANSNTLRTVSVDLTVSDPLNEEAMLSISFIGALQDTTTEISISLNGTLIDVVQWEDRDNLLAALAIPAGLLQHGDNTVELTALSGGGFVDSFTLEYSRSTLLERSALAIDGTAAETTEGLIYASGFGDPLPPSIRSPLTVGGVQSDTVTVLALGDPLQPRIVDTVAMGGTARSAGNTISFYPLDDAEHLVVEPEAWKQASFVRADSPSDLRNFAGAEYLIIAPAVLADAASELAAYRSSTGLSTAVVTLEDVFDEFNHGLSHPQAVAAFLAYANANWPQTLSYVLLVGSGSYDYRDVLGYGDNLFPPVLTATPAGLFAADNLLVDFNQDGTPDIPIGRLPAVSPQEISDYLAKLVAYEQSGGDWTNQILLAAGQVSAEDLARDMDFPADSSQLSALLGASYSATQLVLEGNGSSARSQFHEILDDGIGWFHYTGHGGLNLIGNQFMQSGDEEVFSNFDQLPVMSTATCLVNRFEFPRFSSLGELLTLDADGSAVVVLGPTGLADYPDAYALSEELFSRVFQAPGDVILGEVVVEALGAEGLNFLPSIYSLMGDPAVRLAR